MLNPAQMTAKIFRDLNRRKFTVVAVGDILILLVVTYFMQIAPGRSALQLEGVDKFAEEVKRQIGLMTPKESLPH